MAIQTLEGQAAIVTRAGIGIGRGIALALWLLRCRPSVKIGAPVLIQTLENPWE